jgi:hypothetical protein
MDAIFEESSHEPLACNPESSRVEWGIFPTEHEGMK